MIKVMHILSDGNIGGAGIFVANYAKSHSKDKIALTVVLPKNAAILPKLEGCCKIISCDMPPDKSFSKEAFRVLKEIIKAEKPDIVHTHGSLSGRLAARSAGKTKIVFSKHTLSNVPFGPSKIVLSAIGNLTCNAAVACSKAAAKNLLDCGTKKSKIRVIYNGVSPVPEIPDARAQLGIGEDELVFCIVARLAEIKDHKTFLAAAADANLPNARYLIAGGGELYDELVTEAKEFGIFNKCIFTGQLISADAVYNAADVFVICSKMENLPLSLLEAMSIGLPVAATNVGGIPETVDESCALFSNPGDFEKLSENFTKLADSGLRKKLGDRAREIYNERFTLEICTKNLENLYFELLKKRKGDG